MKSGQLIEYNMRNIFLENSYPICGGETIRRSFSEKNKIEHISGSTVWSFIVCFYRMPSWELKKYIKTELQITCIYLIQSFFKKQKEAWN